SAGQISALEASGAGKPRAVGEGPGDCGSAVGDVQPGVDVLQVGAYGAFGQAEAAGDLGVSVPGRNQLQQVPVPRGEPGDGMAAAFGVQVGLVQVRAQQREQRAVTLGEVRAGPAAKIQPHDPPGPNG